MATDPNFNLRTHQRLFTGTDRFSDEGLRQAAYAAIPKCTTCGAMVMFKGTTPKHYDGSLDKSLTSNDKLELRDSSLRLDEHHPAQADIPKSGAPEIPSRPTPSQAKTKTGENKEQNSPAARAASTRKANASGKATALNTNLGRQFNPDAFDEYGMLKPATQR